MIKIDSLTNSIQECELPDGTGTRQVGFGLENRKTVGAGAPTDNETAIKMTGFGSTALSTKLSDRMLAEERGIAQSAAVYAAGTSPFHVRGSVYQGAMAHADQHVPGGLRRVREACTDPALAEFVGQSFNSTGWYDVLPMEPLSGVIAELLGLEKNEYLEQRTREHATRDLVGLYRLLIRAVSARTVALFFAKLSTRYYDWGSMEARLRGPRRVQTVRSGVPGPVLDWYSTVTCSFSEAALEIAGAPGPRVVPSSCEPDGTRFGVATYAMKFDVTWEA